MTGIRTKNIASKMLQKSCGFTYVYSEDHVDPRNGEDYVMHMGSEAEKKQLISLSERRKKLIRIVLQ